LDHGAPGLASWHFFLRLSEHERKKKKRKAKVTQYLLEKNGAGTLPLINVSKIAVAA
jgi:hypothetical protein